MLKLNLKFKKAKRYILINAFLIFFSFCNSLEAEKIFSKNNEYINYKGEYILGSGDLLKIDFIGLSLFSDIYSINPEGYINLPEIGEINVEGKTTKDLKIILEKEFSEYIYDPDINLSVALYRPLSITLRGEVNKPGLYQISPLLSDSTISKKSNSFWDSRNSSVKTMSNSNPYSFPKLFEAIKLGEGITSYADLKNIQVTRNIASSSGGGKIRTTINLISLLQNGDQNVNIDLRDGDDIYIPKSTKILLDQLIEFNKSNLTPDEIEVFINGNVKKIGRVTFKQGISLFEAISAVGGENSMTGNIEFIRLNKNGTTKKKLLKLDRVSIKGTQKNPILISGDIIYVRKNLYGKFNSIINDYAKPVVNTYGIYKIFD